MTSQPQQKGRRPIDKILSPGFADHPDSLDLVELRARRQLAEQEEVDLSYARRLLQARLDLLVDERVQRVHGVPVPTVRVPRSDDVLARELGVVLSDETPRRDHGRGRHLQTDPSRVGEHRRAAELAVADLRASDPASLSTPELDAAIARLQGFEQEVSKNRSLVQNIMDLLSADMTRRYREGEAQVEDILAQGNPI